MKIKIPLSFCKRGIFEEDTYPDSGLNVMTVKPIL